MMAGPDMDCNAFANLLDHLEDGTLDALERAAAERHLDGCARCRRLRDLFRGQLDFSIAETASRDETQDASDAFVASVLARTSGAACERAAARLCDYVDGTLDLDEAHLLRAHLAHCGGCRRLEAALGEAAALLPQLATLDPGPVFTGRVVAATSDRQQVRPRWRERFEDFWHRLLQRPRVAWEAAYVGAIVLTLIFGNPAARLVSQAGAGAAIEHLVDRAAGGLWSLVGGDAIGAWSTARLDEARGGYAALKQAVNDGLSIIVEWLSDLLSLDLDALAESVRGWLESAWRVLAGSADSSPPAGRAGAGRQ